MKIKGIQESLYRRFRLQYESMWILSDVIWSYTWRMTTYTKRSQALFSDLCQVCCMYAVFLHKRLILIIVHGEHDMDEKRKGATTLQDQSPYPHYVQLMTTHEWHIPQCKTKANYRQQRIQSRTTCLVPDLRQVIQILLRLAATCQHPYSEWCSGPWMIATELEDWFIRCSFHSATAGEDITIVQE